jgi:DNA gyrase/topoisomerase IV subunit A
MTFSEKIDEWIKEAEVRPGSALMILKLVAGRMRDLSERNEELLAENIALEDGTRVLEYQKRITYLEFQLDLLKRRMGASEVAGLELLPESASLNLLLYNANGRILRFELSKVEMESANLGRISGELPENGELPRLLAVPSSEEVMLLFSSGRISTCGVSEIEAQKVDGNWAWDQAALPDEPHAGELLVCLTPLSRLPVSGFLLQASRRGCVKKTMITISDQVLSNHYLGRGAIQKSDQPLEVTLSPKKARFVIVTFEGRVLALDVNDLSFAAEDRIKLNGMDYIVSAFVIEDDQSLLCLTQNGKIIQRDATSLEVGKTAAARGQAFIPPTRMEQGTRFIGAVPFRKTDKLAVLDAQGNLCLYQAQAVCGAGVIQPIEGVFVSIGQVPSAAEMRSGS